MRLRSMKFRRPQARHCRGKDQVGLTEGSTMFPWLWVLMSVTVGRKLIDITCQKSPTTTRREKRLLTRRHTFQTLSRSPNNARATDQPSQTSRVWYRSNQETHHEKVGKKCEWEEWCNKDHIDWQVLGSQEVSPWASWVVTVVDIDHLDSICLRYFKDGFNREQKRGICQ